MYASRNMFTCAALGARYYCSAGVDTRDMTSTVQYPVAILTSRLQCCCRYPRPPCQSVGLSIPQCGDLLSRRHWLNLIGRRTDDLPAVLPSVDRGYVKLA